MRAPPTWQCDASPSLTYKTLAFRPPWLPHRSVVAPHLRVPFAMIIPLPAEDASVADHHAHVSESDSSPNTPVHMPSTLCDTFCEGSSSSYSASVSDNDPSAYHHEHRANQLPSEVNERWGFPSQALNPVTRNTLGLYLPQGRNQSMLGSLQVSGLSSWDSSPINAVQPTTDVSSHASPARTSSVTFISVVDRR
ncbi:uncharacterized protein LAESUDRAFT_468556 [Laetiporus sulphureus 93-53]|uniref:Uncharacterized protein n=1 Tax=Laetiporus sulphureus 93-53 TaxID=1314785 RepID=A0A165G914_9APHY|nr:uncharacterized protein LAESUDRAFT_468556 [Laetiporus sulphureus 93-53]KZT10001.1 hypothetical protein LAESUDRAFT_468556 [Laetiporus sulphureus 93-53]